MIKPRTVLYPDISEFVNTKHSPFDDTALTFQRHRTHLPATLHSPIGLANGINIGFFECRNQECNQEYNQVCNQAIYQGLEMA